MPSFLNRDQIYRILQRELPEGAYPDGSPSAYFSTADMYSVAKTAETAYSNLQSVYNNFWPASCDDKIADWEQNAFGHQLDSSLTLAQRQSRVIAQLRTQRRTTTDDIIQTVYTVIDSSILIEIVPWGLNSGCWVLDDSQLDISTILDGYSGVQFGSNVNWCSVERNPGLIGLTQQQLADYQSEAYTYEVRIYGYTLTADERAKLDAVLRQAEPARSVHIILDGLNPNDSVGGSG